MIVPQGYLHGTEFAERQGLGALDAPEAYPLLPKLGRLDSVCVKLGRFPSFEVYRTWALVQKPHGYFVRRVVWDRAADGKRDFTGSASLYGSEAQLPNEPTATLLAELPSLAIPLALPNRIGLDGVTHSLAISGFTGTVFLSWWCDGPPGWEKIAAWHERTVAFFETHLPTTTFDVMREQA